MSLTLGMEIEYACPRRVNLHRVIDIYYDRNDIEYEYYTHMIEFNKILVKVKNVNIDTIDHGLKLMIEAAIEKGMDIMRRIGPHLGRSLYLGSYPIYKYNGLVFNGIHVHLKYNADSIDIQKLLMPEFINWKLNNNCDLRFVTSHHLWGLFRRSEYRFKRRIKFSPINCSLKYGTTEIRLLNFEDLFYDELRRQVAEIIVKCYELTNEKSKVDISDVIKIYDDAIKQMKESMKKKQLELFDLPCEFVPVGFKNYVKLKSKHVINEHLYEKDGNLYYKTRMFMIDRDGNFVKRLINIKLNDEQNNQERR